MLYAGAFVRARERGGGLSLTTLEAMQSGVPVITLDRPNMIEVTEGAAHLVPDGRTETLTAALRAVLQDPARHADLRRRGLERTRALTWSAMAQRSLDVLWSVATGS